MVLLRGTACEKGSSWFPGCGRGPVLAVTSPVIIKGDSKFLSMDDGTHGNFRHGSLTNDMDLSQTTSDTALSARLLLLSIRCDICTPNSAPKSKLREAGGMDTK